MIELTRYERYRTQTVVPNHFVVSLIGCSAVISN